MTTRDDLVAIKGIKEGLLLTLSPDGDWAAITARLVARLDEKKGFFKGARVAIEVGARPVLPHELESLRLQLSRREMTLWAVVSASPTTQNTARTMGLETTLITQSGQLDAPEVNPEEAGEQAVMISRTLRNGRVVRSNGHVMVIGDVNPGAEIIAVGSIVVWGKVRGIVHAGATGDDTAVVCALDLAPTQLRIASYITVSPEDKRRKPRPEMALVRQGRIVAEAWNG